MQDAARAACVSHSFLSSWRCYPNLTFTNETMCSKQNLYERTVGPNVIRDNNNNIDRRGNVYFRKRRKKTTFNFPCTLLSDMCQGSIRHLYLGNLDLHPTFQLGLRTLKTLLLSVVHITADELGCLLSNSFALAHLRLQYCYDIIRLEIPRLLQRLRFLEVIGCSLQVLEINAPNISRFCLLVVENEDLMLNNRCAISYALDNLPSCAPKMETLTIRSGYEIINAPVISSKFLHLKILNILLFSWHNHRHYDYLSLVSFFEASPSLEKFVLHVRAAQSKYDPFEGDHSSLRRMPEHYHGKLKSGDHWFLPPKEHTTSLRRLTLDTCPVNYRYSSIFHSKCAPLETADIREAHKSVLAVKTYIEEKVPSAVKFNVLEPCSRCYAL
ncbi:hypothetical protein VPH35_098664 [Triticum aestivum]